MNIFIASLMPLL